MQWPSFADPNCQVCGFPWFSEAAPMLWRFPERMKARLQGSRCRYRFRFAVLAKAIMFSPGDEWS